MTLTASQTVTVDLQEWSATSFFLSSHVHHANPGSTICNIIDRESLSMAAVHCEGCKR